MIKRLGPWGWGLVLAQAALATRRHLEQTSPADRARLQELLRASGGRPGNLSDAERQELRETIKRLELGRLARDLAANTARPGRSKRSS
ncbi:MAG: hypothetical protein NVSMB51_18400 [Solirubrobacteraceae bacterium]